MAIPFLSTEIQVMLRDGLRRWGSARDVREAEDFASTWRFAAEQGWLGAGFAEAAGGLGGDVSDTAVIAEELGRALVRAPFVEAASAAFLMQQLAPQRVAGFCTGNSVLLLAHGEAEARGDQHWVETRAETSADGWSLTGRKTAIIGAGCANTILVTAVTDDGLALFEVTADTPALHEFTTIDGRMGGTLELLATPATPVPISGDLSTALAAALDYQLIIESAETVGAMQRAQELACDYLKTRQQYGQLIGDFQVLRHRLADMFIETEQARSIMMRGLGELIALSGEQRSLMAAAVRARVAQAAMFVCAQAIQLHGGIGVTEEYPVGHYFKRALAFSQRHGGADAQVERFAGLRAEPR
jgi:alkylation response protein AidB-like acyl-CoA dehydrogenase